MYPDLLNRGQSSSCEGRCPYTWGDGHLQPPSSQGTLAQATLTLGERLRGRAGARKPLPTPTLSLASHPSPYLLGHSVFPPLMWVGHPPTPSS